MYRNDCPNILVLSFYQWTLRQQSFPSPLEESFVKEGQLWCVNCMSSLLSEVSLQWIHSLSGFSVWYSSSQSVLDYQLLESLLHDTNECFADAVSPSCSMSMMTDSSFQHYESLVKAYDSGSWDSLERWFHSVETFVNSLDEDSQRIDCRVSEA